MKYDKKNIFECIGNTPLVELNLKEKLHYGSIFAKLEYFNPTNSIKDRMVFYVLEKAKEEGKINDQTTIIEGSSGNTGTSVAAYCAINNLQCIIIMSKKVSDEKVNSVKAFGAKVILVDITEDPNDSNSYYNTTAKIVSETQNAFHLNQYHNPLNIQAHYNTTAPELHENIKTFDKKIDAIFIGAGTCGTILGIAKYFYDIKNDIKIISVESDGAVLKNYVEKNKITKPVKTKIEGINVEFITDFVKNNKQFIYDFALTNDDEAFKMCRYLAKTNAILSGGSGGGVVSAAVRYLNENKLNWNVITIIADHGMKYFSKIYNEY